jgi:hypothetical protein
MTMSRKVQRGGGSGRLTDVASADDEVRTDRELSSGDNLMSVNFPEEDGVEHRVEPQAWPVDGDAEAATPEPDAFGPDYGLNPDGPPADGGDPAARPSYNGVPNLPASAVQAAEGYGPNSTTVAGPSAAAAAAMRAAPPYPATAAAQAAAAAMASESKLASPFSALTKSRPKPARPAKPGKTAKPPKPSSGQKKKPPRPQEFRSPQQGLPSSGGSTRRAQLVLSRIEPWSVMKFSFMISLVGWVVLFVAVAGIYFVLSKIGVFTSIESTIGQVTFSKGHPGSNAASWFAASRVLGYTMLAGAINVVLITALATVGAVVYNLVTHLAGGIEVTLKETD